MKESNTPFTSTVRLDKNWAKSGLIYEGYPETKDTKRVQMEAKSPPWRFQTILLTAQTALPAISISFCI